MLCHCVTIWGRKGLQIRKLSLGEKKKRVHTDITVVNIVCHICSPLLYKTQMLFNSLLGKTAFPCPKGAVATLLARLQGSGMK